MKVQLKHLFETFTGIQIFRNSLPRGVDVCRDITRIYANELEEIWDIGAHMGETATYFRSKFAKPTIRSFEPIAENFRILQKRCSEIPDHHSYQLALGDEVKPMRIYLQDASVIHSLRSDLNIPSSSNSKIEEINQYIGYISDISTLPMPIDLPQNLSSKGTKISRSITSIF